MVKSLKALWGLAITALILIGIPYAIHHFLLASLIPQQMPTFQRLIYLATHVPPNKDMINLYASVAYLAWFYLALGTVAEVVTEIRYREVGHKVVGLRYSQALAALWVAPLLAIALHSAPAVMGMTALSSYTQTAPATAQVSAHAESYSLYTVQPGDTLWSIAEAHLGGADAWTTIWNANQGSNMGGTTFTNPSLIKPGWQLKIPGGSGSSVELVGNLGGTPVTQDAVVEVTAPTQLMGNLGGTQVESATLMGNLGGAHTAVSASFEQAGHRISAERQGAIRLAEEIAGTSILAGAFMFALAKKKKRQMATRPDGHTSKRAKRRSRMVETELSSRLGNDYDDVAKLLRSLADAGAPRFESMSINDQTIIINPLMGEAKPGFVATFPADRRWHVARPVTQSKANEWDGSMAVYPAVVSIGRSNEHGAHVINLEEMGTIAFQPDSPLVAQKFARALVSELTWAPWSAMNRIYVYGNLPLADNDDRIAQLTTPEAVLKVATAFHNEAIDAARVAQGKTAPAARSEGKLGNGTAVIVCLDPLGAIVADELVALSAEGVGAAVLMFADQPDTLPVWILNEDWLYVESVGHMTPNLASEEVALVERDLILAATGYREMESTDYAPLAYSKVLDTDAPNRVIINLLGNVHVDGAVGELDRQCIKLLAYLSTHGGIAARSAWEDGLWGGQSMEQMAAQNVISKLVAWEDGLWGGQRNIKQTTAWNIISKLRRSLSANPEEDEFYLVSNNDQTLALGERVMSDLDYFIQEMSSPFPDDWGQAIERISGPLFGGITEERWLLEDGILATTESIVLDGIAKYAEACVQDGESEKALAAITKGLNIRPWEERLIAIQMRASAMQEATAPISGATLSQIWNSYVSLVDEYGPSEEVENLYAKLGSGD